jgi:hypothetical protein
MRRLEVFTKEFINIIFSIEIQTNISKLSMAKKQSIFINTFIDRTEIEIDYLMEEYQ